MTENAESLNPYFHFMQPVLDVLKELGGSGGPSEVTDRVAENLGLTEEQLDERLPSGQSRFPNRVNWARFYLVQAGFLSASQRGIWTLTESGRDISLTIEEATRIARDIRKNFAELRKQKKNAEETDVEEEMNAGDYRSQLLSLIQELPPSGFEQLCQRLLRESGFQKVSVTGKSGDGGIDGHGILQVNAFVSFQVYFQCKRYKDSVGAPMVRDFRGAMMGRADKGIILTTGTFTSSAKQEAIRDGVPPIELVNGDSLIDLLEELQLGLIPIKAFKIDDSFFTQFLGD